MSGDLTVHPAGWGALLPAFIPVWRVLHTLAVEAMDHPIQNAAPQFLKPSGISPPADNGRADGIISPNENAPHNAFSEDVVPKTAQRPDFGAIVGAVHTGGNIAAFLVAVGIATEQTGVAAASDLPVGIPVLVASEEGWVGMPHLVAVCIVVIIAAENTWLCVSNLIPFDIVGVIPTENTGFTVSGLLAVLIVMVDPSKETRFAPAFVSHEKSPPFLHTAIVTHGKSNKLDIYGKATFNSRFP